jgi:HEAT repeats
MDDCQPTPHGPLWSIDTMNPQPQPNHGTFGSLPRAPRIAPAAAVAAGVLLAVLVGGVGTARAAWQHITSVLAANGNVRQSATTDPANHDPADHDPANHDPAGHDLAGRQAQSDSTQIDLGQLDRLEPQTQAEALLERAVGDSDGAVEQISSRLEQWRGKIQWNSQIATLTTAALTSPNSRVRESGVEVELAAYGLAKNSSSLNYVLHAAASADHAKKIWALWSLGLLANRGIGSSVAVQALAAHLQDADQDSRRWAVAGLALVGSPQVVTPLLRTMHDDPSPSVRESAASSLAESGMLTREQRLAAVPQLLNYTDDPALDAQTRTWAFQALTCITGERLPNDSGAWRFWYASAKVD